jgi:23S rRNA (adenine2503-C2)-methyltransferase
MTARPSLNDFDVPALEAAITSWGLNPHHAARLLRSFYQGNGTLDFEALKLGKELTARLREEFSTRPSTVLHRHTSTDGTLKFLLGLARGGSVEAVLMDAATPGRAAGCVSSQLGCAMSCDFCASTLRGLERNLEAGEIVEQFLHLRAAAAESGRQLRTLVFMGMGEPLMNLDQVIPAVRRIAGHGLGELGWRQVCVSTVGVVPGIERLLDEKFHVVLALSLHAPDDETRGRIVPMNRRYAVAEIMAATKRYALESGRIPNIEYCLLRGVNDTDAQARLLAELMRGFRAHVNLIPFNPIGRSLTGVEYHPPTPERVAAFVAILRAAGVAVHVRKTRGTDVDAACGQLRERSLAE